MEFNLSYKIKKAGTESICVPNLKNRGLIPVKIKFEVTELEFTLYSQKNILLKYGKPYFSIYNEVDLNGFLNTIVEGQDLTLSIKNLAKEEIKLGLSIVYEQNTGNIIYMDSFDHEQSFRNCLKDIKNNGLLTRLIIDSARPISSIILDPIYKLTAAAENTEQSILDSFSHWSSSIALQNEKINTRLVIDFTDKDLEGYVKNLEYFKLKIVSTNSEKEVPFRVNVIAYGFKNA